MICDLPFINNFNERKIDISTYSLSYEILLIKMNYVERPDFKDEYFSLKRLTADVEALEFPQKNDIVLDLEEVKFPQKVDIVSYLIHSSRYALEDLINFLEIDKLSPEIDYTNRANNIFRQIISIMMAIPECILMLMNKQYFSRIYRPPIFFEYLDNKMKQNIKIVCYFHYTIRKYLADQIKQTYLNTPKDLLTMLEKHEFSGRYAYVNDLIAMIPENRQKQLLRAFKDINKMYDHQPILELYGMYDMVYELMLSYDIEQLTAKIRNCTDMYFSFY